MKVAARSSNLAITLRKESYEARKRSPTRLVDGLLGDLGFVFDLFGLGELTPLAEDLGGLERGVPAFRDDLLDPRHRFLALCVPVCVCSCMSISPVSVKAKEKEGRKTHETEFVGHGGVAAQVYAESSRFFALSEEDVAFPQEDVPQLVQLGERLEPQFGRGPTPTWCTRAFQGQRLWV